MSKKAAKEPVLTLTKAAFDEVTAALGPRDTWADHYLRVGIKGGGCSGFTYDLDVIWGEPTEGRDVVFHQADPEVVEKWRDPPIRIAIDVISAQYLRGCVIDWEVRGLQRGFRFQNPMAKAQCGCGRSFTT